MIIKIDTDIIKKHENANLCYYLLSLLGEAPIDINCCAKARNLGFVESKDRFENYPKDAKITDYGTEHLMSIIAGNDNRLGIIAEDRCTLLADKLRELFPTGNKPGTKVMWRGNRKVVADRLRKFFVKYGDEWTDEEIIDATKRYVATCRAQDNGRYMRSLPYYIWKNDIRTGELEKTSDLLDYLENTEMAEEPMSLSEFMC